jgi:hypothetical protein
MAVMVPKRFLLSANRGWAIFSKHCNGFEPGAVKGDLSSTKLKAARLLVFGLNGLIFPIARFGLD